MDILLWLQSIRTPAMDVFFSAVTHLGDEVFAVAALALCLWSIDRRFALRMGMAFFMGGMTCQLLKLCVMAPRPWMLDPALIPVPAAVPAATGWSFPSGHTMSAATLFGCLLMRARKPWQRLLYISAALLVAFSRLYLGVHTPLDVGTSLITGAALTALTWFWMEKAETSNAARAALTVAICAVTIMLLAVSLARYGAGCDYDLIEGGFTGVGAAAGFLAAWLLARNFRAGESAAPLSLIPIILTGFAGIVLIKAAIPAMLGENPLGTTISYAMIALWAVWAYPTLQNRIMYRKRDVSA